MKKDKFVGTSVESPSRVARRLVSLVLIILAGCGTAAGSDAGVEAGGGGAGGSGITLIIPDANLRDVSGRVDANLPDVSGPVDGDAEAGALPLHGCADQQARDRYQACLAAHDEQPCWNNGGDWEWLGCLDCGGICNCFLPDDSDCVCAQATDCFSYCLWSPSDSSLNLDIAACSSVAEGRCDVPYDVNGWVVLDKAGRCVSSPARDR